MSSVTLASVLDAVAETLSAAVTLAPSGSTDARTQSYDELTEGMPDTPALQVYPESGTQDIAGSTDRTAFRGGVRQTEFIIHADYYANQRANIGEDMAALVNGIDAIQDVLEQQDTRPYFGLEGIQAFRWNWRRVTFDYAGVAYVGARFVITVRVF